MALRQFGRGEIGAAAPYRTSVGKRAIAPAAAGTDYADLTGEVLFIRDSIDSCHDVAAGAGTRIVHCCGFDSVPSDLGVLLLHPVTRFRHPVTRVRRGQPLLDMPIVCLI